MMILGKVRDKSADRPRRSLRAGVIVLLAVAMPLAFAACKPKDPSGSGGVSETGGSNTSGGSGSGSSGSSKPTGNSAPSVPTVMTISPKGGETTGGQTVTITGVDLSDVTDVKFGGVACTNVKAVSDKVLTCVTPAHAAGVVYVSLTTKSDITVTVNDAYTYWLPIALDIGAPSASPVNQNATVSYELTYTSADTVTLAASNVSMITTGTASCTVAVSGTGKVTRYVSLSHCAGDGTVAISIASNTAQDPNGKAAPAAGPSQSFQVDNTAPALATAPVWSQSSPFAGTTASAQWTKSGASDLADQHVQFYTGSACNTASGSEIDLASTSLQALAFTGTDGNTYTFRVISIDQAGNRSSSACSAALAMDVSLPTVSNVTSTSADGSYTIGAVIPVQVRFAEPVNVTGTPTLTLETGATDRVVSYASGTGTNTLVFNYTVQAGDNTNDLDYVATTSLALNGGTIRDGAGNNATLTLPSPGATGSLSVNKAIVIDTGAPSVTGVSASTADGSYKTGSTIDVTVTFSESVVVSTAGGTPSLTLETGTTDRAATYLSGSGSTTLTFRYTVVAGDAASDLDYVATTALALNGGTIRDASANDATLTLPSPGAAGSLGANKAIVVDTTAPTVTNVTSASADGSYNAGNIIDVSVTFSESVTVNTGGGTPSLQLATGGAGRSIAYLSGSGSSTLVFRYTVQSGDSASDLDYMTTSALSAGGGTIRDSAGNDATLTLAAPGAAGSLGANKAIVVDGNVPAVLSIDSTTADGSYKAGASIAVTVTFSENVTVNTAGGTPTLKLETGTTDQNAVYSGGTGSSVLTFTYTVQAGDTSTDLDIQSTSALALNGGTIRDGAANNAILTLPTPGATGSLAANRALVIDNTAPTVTNVTSTATNGAYKVGQTVNVTVTFSEIVAVNTAGGTPLLHLETGAVDHDAVYTGGTGTNTLTFTYTIQSGDTAADLDYKATTSLATNGGTIRDSAGNDATLTLASPGAVGSLGGNKDIVIDTSSATVTSVSASTANGSYKAAATVDVTVTFSESVIVDTSGGTPKLKLETGTTDQDAVYLGGSGGSTLTFRYTVQAGDTASDLDFTGTTALALSGGTIRDVAGNDATLTLPNPGAAGSLAANKDIVIDTTAPTVSSVSASTANGTYGVGQAIAVTVQFSETVVVDTTGGTPTLQMDAGASTRYAVYSSGTGSNTLTFNYTVQSGDVASDLDYKTTAALTLVGGTIKDGAGNSATLTLASPGAAGSLGANKNIVVDTSGPNVTSVSSSKANGSYGAGTAITVTVTFSEAVTVDTTGGTPSILLETGTTDRAATYAAGSGGATLSFSYTVQAGDNSIDLDYASTGALSLNGGTIKDSASNDATLTLPSPGAAGSLGANKDLLIDTTPPVVTNVFSNTSNGSYKAGQVIDVRVTFDSAVTVDTTGGSPTVTLETGTTDRTATYASGSGTSTLVFNYTVQAGDSSSDLDYLATNALALAGATIKDAAGNGATLTLPSPGAATSLGGNQAIVIDTAAPTVTSVSASTADGSYKAGDAIAVTVTFSENVTVSTGGGTPVITLETGTTDRDATYASGSGGNVLTFNYTVVAGDSSSDLDYKATTSLSASGGTIRDAAGNDATLTLASPGAAGSLGASKAIVIDTSAPTLVISAPSPTIVNSAGSVDYTVTYTGASSISLAAADISLTATGGATCSKAVSGTGATTRTVTLSGCTGNGTVKISIAAATAVDAAGNAAASAGPSTTFTVDNTAPLAATSLGWSQSSPSNSASVTAQWTKSSSADLADQKIQFYTDSNCTVATGSLIDLSSSTAQTRAFTGIGNTSYNYTIASIDTAGNSAVSACSSTMAINVLPLDLEVPFELLDVGVGSVASTATAIPGSSTPLRTDDFDGTVTYVFEVVASNNDSSNRAVKLVDQNNAVKATITVNAGTSSGTRLRTTWTPNAAADDLEIYRVRLDGTTNNDDLVVTEARILVQQSGATMTKLFIPLTAGASTGSVNAGVAGNAAIDSRTSTSYGQTSSSSYSVWRKNSAAFADLAATTPWSLIAVLSASCNTSRVALFNSTANAQVTTSVTTSSATPVMLRADFADTTTNFDDGSDFEVRIRSGNGACQTDLHRAGLLVKLTNLNKAEVYYRVARGSSLNATTLVGDQRAVIDSSLFSNPTVSFESVGSISAGGSGGASLLTVGANDSGTAGSSLISGSARTYSTTKSRQRSAGLSITDGDRYIESVDVSAGTVTVNQSFVIIDTH